MSFYSFRFYNVIKYFISSILFFFVIQFFFQSYNFGNKVQILDCLFNIIRKKNLRIYEGVTGRTPSVFVRVQIECMHV